MVAKILLFTRRHAPTFLRFLVCGGLAACIDFGTLHFLIAYAGWTEARALLVSTGLALIFVFIANRFFTFGVRGGGVSTQAAKFLMVYLTAASLNYGLTLSLIFIGVHYLLAKAMAIGLIMFFNYALLHGFVFKKKKVIPDEEVLVA
jgi:putative flippase GtrA